MTAVTAAAGLAIAAGLYIAGDVVRNMNYDRWDAWRVRRAGFEEKQTQINGTTLNYAEGPAGGPPLLLIHGQLMAWSSYHRVLPELADDFHVFAVDLPGHGKSDRAQEKYTANALAEDLRAFIEGVIGKPAIVGGHSSGGLVAANLAARWPRWVMGLLLEDPPFFSSLHPRVRRTFDYVDVFEVAHDFLQSGEDDFTLYYIQRGAMWDLFSKAKPMIQGMATRYRESHPDQPLKLFIMPPEVNRAFSAMDDYDPHFGDAFYTNRFHEGFDHAETLRQVGVPTALVYTDLGYDDDGLLIGAMDQDDVERVQALLYDVELYQVPSGNTFHYERPEEYASIVRSLRGRCRR